MLIVLCSLYVYRYSNKYTHSESPIHRAYVSVVTGLIVMTATVLAPDKRAALGKSAQNNKAFGQQLKAHRAYLCVPFIINLAPVTR